jgi:putative membrane-bound dehydrogenase-like protein
LWPVPLVQGVRLPATIRAVFVLMSIAMNSWSSRLLITRVWLAAILAILTSRAATAQATGRDFPDPPNTEPSSTQPLAPDVAAAGFRCPDGFKVNVFAAEPDVRNPIATAWDTRGRLWVAENYTYSDSTQKFDLRLRDRVLILEDSNADGRMDTRKVFTDQVQRLGSVELGFGGVWLMCPPQLLFVPDRDGDGVPDGPAEVVLDGFTVATENYHTFANGLRWGPDGWLYGRCGASSPGTIGVPGTPDADRIPLRGGIWRYHPARQRFEVLAHGTTNPWGHDWNALGEAFFINTTNGHLWHLIPGAHFARPHTIEPNPRAYAIIDQHADHYHWDNSQPFKNHLIPGGIDDHRGGGHAHTGVMIYLADQWPEPYRGKLFTLNFHGRRFNVERLERSGGGYVGRHESDIFFAADPWYRGMDLAYGPDASVFVLDWSDTGECHEREGVHRSSGRIYRITYGTPRRALVRDVAALGERELAALHGHANEWFVRQARRVMAERSARGEPLVAAKAALRKLFDRDPDPSRKIRALCSIFVIGGTDRAFLRGLLKHEHESVRAWAIRLLADALPIDTIYSRRGGPDVELPNELRTEFAAMARDDPSGLVRLVLASTLQRLPAGQRAELAQALASRSEDDSDHNIPALIWTGLIPLADADPVALVRLAENCRLPSVLRLIARRLGEDIDSHPAPLNALLDAALSRPEAFKGAVVAGLSDAVTGWRKATKPAAWDHLEKQLSAASDANVRARARDLNLLFGDGRALDQVKRLALDDAASLEVRKAALKSLIDARPPELRAICERLVRVRFLNAVAARGLTFFDDPAIGATLAKNYRTFHPSERSVALEAMASRPAFALALLDQISAGKIPRQDLTAFHARQIRSLGDPVVTKRLAQVWGIERASAADRQAHIAALKKHLSPTKLGRADPSHGRAVFDKVCASCHKLYGYGGDIGPDLTGAGRDNIDYLLENLVDPSASVSADFRMVAVAMSDGRVLNGLVRAQTDRTLTLQTQTDALVLDRREIETVQPSPSSLMPDGLLTTLSETETRDLIAYLMHRTQVPLPRNEK